MTKLNVRQQAQKNTKVDIHTKDQEKPAVTHQMTLTLAVKDLLESWRRVKKPVFYPLSVCAQMRLYPSSQQRTAEKPAI